MNGTQSTTTTAAAMAQKAAIVAEVRQSIDTMAGDAEVVEIRALDVPARSGRPFIASGYFDRQHRNEAAEAAFWFSYVKKAPGVYMTLNPVNPALLARAPNKMQDYVKNNTADAEIVRRQWLFVDIDPHRPSGIAASEEERRAAIDLAEIIVEKLRAYSFPYPVFEDSGNGQYLLYRIDLPNDAAATDLIKAFYSGLNTILPGIKTAEPYAEIDCTVNNAGRIARVGGTLNRKGFDTPDRPHRQARLAEVPADEPLEIVPRERIEAVAALAQAKGTNGKAHNNGQHVANSVPQGRIDVPGYCNAYGVKISGTKTEAGRTIYLLERCPFNENHGRGESSIVQADSGLTTFHCKHNSCSGYKWADFKGRVGPLLPEHLGKPDRPTTPAVKPKQSAPLVPGMRVRAGDRGNIGEIVADNGSTALVHFVSPEGQHANVDLPKSELKALDGQAIDGGEPEGPPRFVEVVNCREFLAMDLKTRFLVRNVLAVGQPAVMGGRSKTLKTSLAIDLAVSLGSGTPFLGQFDVQQCNAAVWSGESGAAVVRETAKRQAAARGVDLAGCNIDWGFSLPKLSRVDHLAAMADVIEKRKLQVIIVDPLYLCLLDAQSAGQAGNVFAMGAVLEPLTAMGQATGATIILLHHFRKSGLADDQEPAGLEELSMSGVAEWARQWILLQRRSAYQADGHHELWMRTGGSAGHAGLWALDIDEGTLDPDTYEGRRWDVTVKGVSDARQEAKAARATRKAEELERREGEHIERVLEALRRFPAGETEKRLRVAAKLNQDNFSRALWSLEHDGRIEVAEIQKGKMPYQGWRLKR